MENDEYFELNCVIPESLLISRGWRKMNIFGKWKDMGGGIYKCTVCGEHIQIDAPKATDWKYCPVCGSRIIGESDEDAESD